MSKEGKENKNKSKVSRLDNLGHYIFMNKNRDLRKVREEVNSCLSYV